jgi:hypothetical protein
MARGYKDVQLLWHRQSLEVNAFIGSVEACL